MPTGSSRPPLSPNEGWLSDGRQVLHFRPVRYTRFAQALEVTLGERLPEEAAPLLKRRKELTREQAIRLWRQKRQQGWRVCPPQWRPPRPGRAWVSGDRRDAPPTPPPRDPTGPGRDRARSEAPDC